ncbi:shikimate kinase [Paenibacillus sp. FSL H8-0548]|uniref:shikimate kinase n=1 Tax=Paenibacillus sp. FSL H8-0548 TaxID=1920422 RepID=UPI00096BD98A|nr:shikimate kinase [Paenibacillus sp. FSL H8-0548]OMF37573.1 shikimate kinase [Paenibacillus sp. FSL H8-0548]
MVRQKPNKLVLIGFMGTGKSTVSKLLAEKLGWMRVDVDEEIERSENKRISDIFAADGEASFRAIELNVLASILESGDSSVVATGGGAVLSSVNRELMLSKGFVVALKASPEQILARVKTDSARPLLQGDAAERVNVLLEQRKHAYDFAHLSVDTTNLSADAVVEVILEQWSLQK